MSHQISPDQIAYKKRIGTLGSAPVYEVGLIGGLHMVLKAADGKTVPLGAGPHRAVARHIARKKNPELQINELSKSDHIEPHLYEQLLPKYEALTDALVDLRKATKFGAYTISHETVKEKKGEEYDDPTEYLRTDVSAHDEAGNQVGYASLWHDSDGLFPEWVEVHPDHRRRGVASAMYRHAETALGMPIKRAGSNTTLGAKFRAAFDARKKGE